MIPRATYRIQFHKGFTFADAAPLAFYLKQLGISHVYASPIFTARAGSMHGYDAIDPTRINPELGGEVAFLTLVSALRAEGLGLIVDIVPNHMAVGGADNAWWLDVLEKGQAGAYAGKALDANGVKSLASIPSKEVLLAQLCGLLNSPVSGFARLLAALAAKNAEGAPAEAEAPAA